MLMQIVAKFDPMEVNVKDVKKALEDVGIKVGQKDLRMARETAPPKPAKGKKGAAQSAVETA